MKRLILFVFFGFLLLSSCSDDPVSPVVTPVNNSPPASIHSSSTAVEWMSLACDIVAIQRLSPPLASRFYSYTAITIYECTKNGMPGYNSLSGQLNGMPVMPVISVNDICDWPSVITGAIPVIMNGILDTVYSQTDQKISQLKIQQEKQRRSQVEADVVDRSLLYGRHFAETILSWAGNDNYIQTRSMVYNVPPRTINPAYWAPTDSVNLNPVEPFWGQIRTFALTNQAACDVTMNIPFSPDKSSAFYNEAVEVKTVKENLTQEQKDIALFWADGGGTATPSGHWLSVMAQISNQQNLKLDNAAEMYVLGCIAMADAFISCWESKYRYNLLRPKTYIRDYVGPADWMPFITTPPFPEYTSGHSVQSSAVCEILSNLFGASYTFTDTTHSYRGFQPRTYTGFQQARDEAALSRLYGGIHYRQAIERGKMQGQCVGQTVLSRVRLKN